MQVFQCGDVRRNSKKEDKIEDDEEDRQTSVLLRRLIDTPITVRSLNPSKIRLSSQTINFLQFHRSAISKVEGSTKMAPAPTQTQAPDSQGYNSDAAAQAQAAEMSVILCTAGCKYRS